MWDELYTVFDRLNFRGDLVKQVCEPLSCFSLGLCAYLVPQLADLHFGCSLAPLFQLAKSFDVPFIAVMSVVFPIDVQSWSLPP